MTSGQYNFYYTTFVTDKNTAANSYVNNYNLIKVPTTFYDGGHGVYVGTVRSKMESRIEDAQSRTANDIDLTLSMSFLGGGELEIIISVTNNQFINTVPDRPSSPSCVDTMISDGTYDITVTTTDFDDQNLWYMFDWDNGVFSEWLGPYPSGDNAVIQNKWTNPGEYGFRVMAKDEFDAETIYSMHKYITVIPRGDADGDHGVTLGDVIYIVNYVFKGGTSPEPLERADANCDGMINLGDAIFLINYIFKRGDEPGCY